MCERINPDAADRSSKAALRTFDENCVDSRLDLDVVDEVLDAIWLTLLKMMKEPASP
jgi:hypothetical protein